MLVLVNIRGCSKDTNDSNSASPLNGEAALLWDRDQAEYKKKVLARHQEPSELEQSSI